MRENKKVQKRLKNYNSAGKILSSKYVIPNLDQRKVYMISRGWKVALAGLGVNLALGVLYSWGVFAAALRNEGWSATQSQIPYMAACAVFALLMVPGGRIQDKSGPKAVLLIAAVLTCIGFVMSGIMMSVMGLTIFFGIVFGTAMGFGYASTTPAAVKWFGPQNRGMISGIVVSGFGLAGIYIAPLTTALISGFGLAATFIMLGVVFSVMIFLLRMVITDPPKGYVPHVYGKAKQIDESRQSGRDYEWREMIRTPQFVLLWIMFLFGTFAGLLILGQLSNIGKEQAGASAQQAIRLVVIYAVFNWLGRIVSGMLSDRLGRRATLFSIFMIQVICFAFFASFTNIFALTAGTALVAFSFGGMLSGFPALTADFFGVKNLGMNYGLVFTAWGGGGVFGPLLGGMVRDMTGAYDVSFIVSAALCLIGAMLSLITTAPKEQMSVKIIDNPET